MRMKREGRKEGDKMRGEEGVREKDLDQGADFI